MLGQIFTHEMKPMEVEILVAEIGDGRAHDQLFHITLRRHASSTRTASPCSAARPRPSPNAWKPPAADDLDQQGALQAAAEALGGPDRTARRPIDLEVAVLYRANGRRPFQRLEADELTELLGVQPSESTADAPVDIPPPGADDETVTDDPG